MEWCCVQFKYLVERAGPRGMAIIIDASHGDITRYYVQFRAADYGLSITLDCDEKVSLLEQKEIVYCPWCGVNLADRYNAIATELSRPELLQR